MSYKMKSFSGAVSKKYSFIVYSRIFKVLSGYETKRYAIVKIFLPNNVLITSNAHLRLTHYHFRGIIFRNEAHNVDNVKIPNS